MDRSVGELIHLAHQARANRRLLLLGLLCCGAATAGTLGVVWCFSMSRYHDPDLVGLAAFLVVALWAVALVGIAVAAYLTVPGLAVARQLVEAGCFDEARYLLVREGASEEATFLLGRAQEGAGDVTRATAQYRLYLERHPRGAWALVARERLGELARVRFSGRIHVGPRRAPELEAAGVELAPLPPQPPEPVPEPIAVARDDARCPYCHAGFGEDDETQAACGACHTRHHAACYDAAGCAVNGCRNGRRARESVA